MAKNIPITMNAY